jgi:DNA-binding protein WhiA
MTFSNDVRNELARIIPEKSCCQKAELCALLTLRAELFQGKNGGRYLNTIVESATPARKIYRLFKEAYNLSSTVKIQEKKRFKKSRLYVVETQISNEDMFLRDMGLNDGESKTKLKRQVNWSLISKNCCKRSYLRGVFISRGFINRPEGNYHLEVVLNDSKLAGDIKKIMQKLGIMARISERKNNLIIYIKESEKIVDFLRIIEASKALLILKMLESLNQCVTR